MPSSALVTVSERRVALVELSSFVGPSRSPSAALLLSRQTLTKPNSRGVAVTVSERRAAPVETTLAFNTGEMKM